MDDPRNDAAVKQSVREGYAAALETTGGCCGGTSPDTNEKREVLASRLGYDAGDLASLPDGAVDSAFGCGNPVAFAEVRAGDVLLDIGSGAGIDCILAAKKVGPDGRVIGLDMTSEMIDKAKENVSAAGLENVEFRLGDAESMPVEDGSVDWIVSNCVINLAPNKPRVFREIARVLKPGGRVSVSDIVISDELPEEVARSVDALVGCIAGAVREEDYLAAMGQAGLVDVEISSRLGYGLEQSLPDAANDTGSCCGGSAPVRDASAIKTDAGFRDTALLAKYHEQLAGKVWSIRVSARRPE